MWPDLRDGAGDVPPRPNPFVPPVDVPTLQVTLDHLLDPGFSDEYHYFRELMALDQFTPVRQVGAFPDLGGLEFEFGPLDGYPEDIDESCRLVRSQETVGYVWMPRTTWDTAYMQNEVVPERNSPEARETRAAILANLSVRLGSHILVSGRVDFRPPADYFRSNHCEVQEALAILGLHMRTHGSPILVNRSGLTLDVERSQSETLEAARLMPVLRAESSSGEETRVAGLAQACLERMARLLRARDRVLIAQTMSGPSRWVDPCVDTEAAAVAFTAALDALARFINAQLQWDMSALACGFHKQGFASRLSALADLPQQRAALARAKALAKVVSEVRNTLHAEPLGRAYLRSDGRGPTAVVHVHREVATSIAEQCAELGTYDRWLMETEDGSLLLNPFTFVNDLAVTLPAIADPIAAWLLGEADVEIVVSSDLLSIWSVSNMERNARLYGLWLWSIDPTSFSVDGTVHRGPSLTRSGLATRRARATPDG